MRDASARIEIPAADLQTGGKRVVIALGAVVLPLLCLAPAVLSAGEAGVPPGAPQTIMLMLAETSPSLRIAAPTGGATLGIIWFGKTDARPGAPVAWGGPR